MREPGESTGTDRLLVIYRGPFLHEKLDALWAMPARERLRTRFLQAIEHCGRGLEQREAWLQSTDLYLRALESEPMAEVLSQGLMRCHLKTIQLQ